MIADIWKDRDVAKAFLSERSLSIPDRPRQLGVLLRVLRLSCPQIRRILDVGTGDGLLLATVLDAFPESNGVGVDFSPLMLEQARLQLAKYGPRRLLGSGTVEADLQSTTWKDALTGPFDAVISGLAIHHLTHERKRSLYQEIFDLLSPGGVFLNCEHIASATVRTEEMYNDAMSEHLYLRRKEKGEDVTLEQVRREFLEPPDAAANILAPLEDQCQWLREIGFSDVDCFWRYFELAIFGGRKATGG